MLRCMLEIYATRCVAMPRERRRCAGQCYEDCVVLPESNAVSGGMLQASVPTHVAGAPPVLRAGDMSSSPMLQAMLPDIGRCKAS